MPKLLKEINQSQFKNFSKDINYDIDIWIEQLKNCYLLQECQLKDLCKKVKYYIYSIYIYIGKRNCKA